MSGRFVYLVAAIMILTAGYACWCRAPLIWDGAFQFDWTLELQSPFVYTSRFHTYLLWWPTVWASGFTDNVMVLQTLFGLPFLLAPAVGLLLSWWIVKDHQPELIIWVIFGVAIATLPGQIFVINDSIFQLHLFWPVFVGLFVPLSPVKKVALALLAVFQFAHPIGALLLLGAAIAAGSAAVVDQTRRRALLIGAAVMLTLSAAVIAKVAITQRLPGWYDDYAEREATWTNAMLKWHTGVVPVLRGLCWVWVAGVLAFVEPLVSRRLPRWSLAARLIVLGSTALGARYWCMVVRGPQAGEQVWWCGAIDYRRWVVPLAAPFFFFLAAESCWRGRMKSPRPSETTIPSGRGPLAILLAAVFALYLGTQCLIWDHLTGRLLAEVREYPSVVVPLLDRQFEWTKSTPLTHWAAGNYIAAMQGKRPRKVFVDATGERWIRGIPLAAERVTACPPTQRRRVYPAEGNLGHLSPYYPISITDPPGKMGWFDFRPMLRELDNEPPPTRARRDEQSLSD